MVQLKCPTCGKTFQAFICETKKFCNRGCYINRPLPARTRHLFQSEYQAWKGMNKRCHNLNCKDYANYGQRGIVICEQWKSFLRFFTDMGPKPSSEYTIERINNSLGYSKDNCKWATRAEQNRNKRNIEQADYNGQTIPRIILEEKLGFSKRRIDDRLRKGWTLEQAINTPQRKSPSKKAREGLSSPHEPLRLI